MVTDSIFKIRTAPEIIKRTNWLTGYWWYVVATPHRKSDISHLTMGEYQNYTHREFSFWIIDGHITINRSTRHNDHVSTDNGALPYRPEDYSPELIPLFDELIELTRNNQHKDLTP